MTANNDLLALDPQAIDASGSWLFWAVEPEASFVRCLEESGQLEPVLIARDPDGWSLLTGYKRLMACRSLGKTVWARCLEADALSRGKIYLWSNWPRRLEPVEALLPARYFQAVCPAADLRGVLEELFQDILSFRQREDLLTWLGLPDWLDGHVLAGRLPLEAGRILIQLDASDLSSLEPFFAELSWSRNKARQFLSWLLETARREGRRVDDLLCRAELPELLRSDFSPKDRLHGLLYGVRQLRYPELVQLEEEFKDLQDRIRKTSVWKVQAEPGFETDRLDFVTRIKTRADLVRAARDLDRLADHGDYEVIRRWQAERLDRSRQDPDSS